MAHSLQAVSLDKLQDFLECSICLEKLTNPRTLPCFHSFCLPCLEEFVNKKRADATIPQPVTQFDCPECRRSFSLNPGAKVVDMIPNHFVVSMLEVMALGQHRVKGVPCSRDCEASSIARCVDCNAFLCESCLSDHNNYFKGNKSHSVLSMDELSKPENWSMVREKQYCQQHQNKKLKFYCETCQQLICRDCTDFNHEKPDHHWLPIATVAEKERQKLSEMRDVLKGRLTKGKKTAQKITKAHETLDESKEEAVRAIIQRKDDLLEELTEKLDKKAHDLMVECDKLYTAEQNSLLQLENKTTADVKQLENCVSIAEVFLEQATDEDVVSSAGGIKRKCDEFQDDSPEKMINSVNSVNFSKYASGSVDLSKLSSCVEQMRYLRDPDSVIVIRGKRIENECLRCPLSAKVKLFVHQGDITEQKVDAIVNPANGRLDHDGRAAKVISTKGGSVIREESKAIMRNRNWWSLQPGNAVTTSAGSLPCDFVVHAVGPKWDTRNSDRVRSQLKKSVTNSLHLANVNRARSIAIPAISSGIFGVPVNICAQVLFDAAEEIVRQVGDAGSLAEIRFVNIDEVTVMAFRQEMKKRYGQAVTSKKIPYDSRWDSKMNCTVGKEPLGGMTVQTTWNKLELIL